jgi:hypothetical protein
MFGLTVLMQYFLGAGILTAGITMVLVIYGNACQQERTTSCISTELSKR